MVTPNTEPTDDGASQIPEVVAQNPETTEATQARTFDQESVNRMMANIRREERGKFSDYDQLKARAAKADELEQAQLSEQEKLAQRATDAERQASEAATKIADVSISADVQVKAVQMGVVDPQAAYLLMDRSSVTYDPATGVNGVDEALTRLLEEKPYLRGNSPRTPNINPEGGTPAPVTRLSDDQREAARLMGMTDEEYASGI